MSHDHEIVKCSQCHRVIRQCRCPGENKAVRFEYCGCNERRNQLDYSIALQRAIETHCRGLEVAESEGNCPHHAKMLNRRLARHLEAKARILETLDVVMAVLRNRSGAWMELREVKRLLEDGHSKYFGIEPNEREVSSKLSGHPDKWKTCCLDIFNDFTEREARDQPPSVYSAWKAGQQLGNSE